MMNFRTIKTNIVNLLAAAEVGRFVTIGFQRQGSSANIAKGNNRTVQVYFQNGDFPKNKGRLTGPVQHDITYIIELTTAAPAKVDLSVLDNLGSTPAQKSSALAAMKESAEEADNLFDELAEIVYQILMDARNIDLGSSFTVANRWIPNIRKDDPLNRGELVTLTGTMSLTCSIDEQVTGDTPVDGDKVFNTTTQVSYDENDDPIDDAGVIVDQAPFVDTRLKLRLPCDGVNGSQLFTDTSASGHIITTFGNAQVDTSEKVTGTGSLLMGGAGDFLRAPASSDWDFAGGDFKIDLWMRTASLDTTRAMITRAWDENNNKSWLLEISFPNDIFFGYSTTGSDIKGFLWDLSLIANAWDHVVLERIGTNLILTLDEVPQAAKAIGADVIYDNGGHLDIGSILNFPVISDFNGWMDEIMVFKG